VRIKSNSLPKKAESLSEKINEMNSAEGRGEQSKEGKVPTPNSVSLLFSGLGKGFPHQKKRVAVEGNAQ